MGIKNIIEITDDLVYVNSDVAEKLFYTTDQFETDKAKISFIKTVEKTIRGSVEYRRFIKYIKEELELTNCTVLSGIDSTEVKIEMHHTPFTLFDLVEIILNRRLSLGIPISTFSMAEESMVAHYQGIVGLVQLSQTMHELVHSNRISISRDEIIGNVKGFFDVYEVHFNEDHLIKYHAYLESSGSHFIKSDLTNKEKTTNDISLKIKINDMLNPQEKLEERIHNV